MTYSLDLREKVVAHIEKGGSVVEAVKIFGIGRRTIHQWLHQKKSEGHLNAKKYVRTKHKIDRAALEAHVAEIPDAYLKERADALQVSVSGVWRALKTMKITRKKSLCL